jgi:hypothetical protein
MTAELISGTYYGTLDELAHALAQALKEEAAQFIAGCSSYKHWHAREGYGPFNFGIDAPARITVGTGNEGENGCPRADIGFVDFIGTHHELELTGRQIDKMEPETIAHAIRDDVERVYDLDLEAQEAEREEAESWYSSCEVYLDGQHVGTFRANFGDAAAPVEIFEGGEWIESGYLTRNGQHNESDHEMAKRVFFSPGELDSGDTLEVR